MPHLLSAMVFIPLLCALITMCVPQKASKWVALFLGVGALKYSIIALYYFNPAQPGLQFIELQPWLPSLNINYLLAADVLSPPLIDLSALLTPLCSLASWKQEKNPRAFFAALLALQGFVNGVFVAQDFILFYLFWEAMLIPMFLLIGLWGGENRVYAALKFF